jgi:DNA-binding transcriptional ArsR family regulator
MKYKGTHEIEITIAIMERKLGRLPYMYEIIEETGLPTKAIAHMVSRIPSYPKNLAINPAERDILVHWKENATPKQIADKLGKTHSQVGQYLLSLREKGVIEYNKQTRVRNPKEVKTVKKLSQEAELKPLPTKRMWQRDPASGMVGGIL